MANNNKITRNSTRLSKSRQNQIEYWSKRAENNFLAGEKDALQVAKELAENYKSAMKKIEEKINGFYGKYASQNKMSFEEVKQLLSKSELKSFKEYLDECIEFKKKYEIPSRQYELLKLKTKITRWEELRTQIQHELDKLTVSTQDDVEKMLYDNYREGYYKTVFDAEQFKGFSSSFNGLDKQAIGRAINTKWLGDNYSSRIWKNENSLMNILNQDLPRGLALGTNPRELSRQVSKRLNTNYNNTVRLVRTEYANVLNNSTLAGYKASGIDRYQILAALDERTCDDCDDFNEEIFEVKDAQEGINMPPFHPNCRCTTIPYFEKDEIDEMSDEELSNIGFITYDEWKEGLVTLKNGKVIYEFNREKPYKDKNFKFLPDDDVEAHDKFFEMSDECYDKLDTIERGRIKNGYVGSQNSFRLNETLRDKGYNGLNDNQKELTDILDKACSTYIAKEDMASIRFVSEEYLRDAYKINLANRFENYESMKKYIGSELNSNAFTSVSLREEGSWLFNGLSVKIKINLPKGTSMYITENASEYEAILGRNTKMILKQVDYQKGKVSAYDKILLTYEVKK